MKKIVGIFFLLGGVLIVLSYLLLVKKLHLSAWLGYLIAINMIMILFYGLDKLFAKYNRIRIPELVLHGMELAGGTPGALFSQQLFWHKSTKRSYQVLFWFIVLIQIIGIYLIFYTDLLKTIF